ncbi:dTMP kinase [Campylobacter showae]|uniref:Thymidylate kinase n=1 Tax=Campylobacter showae RM3277 TaxID=553219 RepID=C6RF25_9BACT|nr:dTMP kinase [Campylobacter showae]EET79833.1 dTMP kinase [Campylobacter showae RM3277]QCD48943.1 dTMP kinase [Campylobacter showae]
MYILFEGIDGAGKSTQIARLAAAYTQAIVTKEPGGTKLGENLREILLKENDLDKRAEILLFLADRAEHFGKIIKPNLDKMILSDRGFVSGMAYALAGGNFSFEELLNLNKFALQGNFPQKIVFFKADESTLRSRLGLRAQMDGIEARGFEYLLRVQDAMEEILQKLGVCYVTIGAAWDEEKITNLIKEFIND